MNKKFERVLELAEELNSVTENENWFDKGPFKITKRAVSISADNFEWLMSNVEDYEEELKWLYRNAKYGNDFKGPYYEWVCDDN